jgi:2-polyprenyl-3-methyl-5-hydroxy-6-metoxy-1,4-benzoquinol methylase
MARKSNAEVLDTGAKKWHGTVAQDHSVYAPIANWTGTDIEDGKGVGIVGDLQRLHKLTERRFDGVFCCSTLEHIERPWTAMYAIGKLLKPSGVLYLDTHQTFPLHGYPLDYFRFSLEALKVMCFDAGLDVVAGEYAFPCVITPPDNVNWNPAAESYLNVAVCAIKKELK